jgi:hypothetical protein
MREEKYEPGKKKIEKGKEKKLIEAKMGNG